MLNDVSDACFVEKNNTNYVIVKVDASAKWRSHIHFLATATKAIVKLLKHNS